MPYFSHPAHLSHSEIESLAWYSTWFLTLDKHQSSLELLKNTDIRLCPALLKKQVCFSLTQPCSLTAGHVLCTLIVPPPRFVLPLLPETSFPYLHKSWLPFQTELCTSSSGSHFLRLPTSSPPSLLPACWRWRSPLWFREVSSFLSAFICSSPCTLVVCRCTWPVSVYGGLTLYKTPARCQGKKSMIRHGPCLSVPWANHVLPVTVPRAQKFNWQIKVLSDFIDVHLSAWSKLGSEGRWWEWPCS